MSKRSADAARALLLAAAFAAAPAWAKPTPKPAEAAPAVVELAAPAPIPADVQHAYDAALVAMQAGAWAQAETALKALTEAQPELPGPAVNLGIVYRQLQRAEDARKQLQSAAEHWPQFAPAQHQLGVQLREDGKFADADAAFAQALAANPDYALAYYDRAVLNELYLQRLPEALNAYEQYQRLQAAADEQVNRWIADLRRRTGVAAPATPKPAEEAVPAAAEPANAAPAAPTGNPT